MVRYLPSEIARIVYGYLRSNNLNEAAEAFLRTSPNLEECREFMDTSQFRHYTTIDGYSLENILNEYKAFCDLILDIENQKVCRSQAFRTLSNGLYGQYSSQGTAEKNLETSHHVCDSTTVKPECHSEILSDRSVDKCGPSECAFKRKLDDDCLGMKNRKLMKIYEIIQSQKENNTLNSSSSDSNNLIQSNNYSSHRSESMNELVVRCEDMESGTIRNGTVEDTPELQICNQEESKTSDELGDSSTAIVTEKSFDDVRINEYKDDEHRKYDCGEIELNCGTIDGGERFYEVMGDNDGRSNNGANNNNSDGKRNNNGVDGMEDISKLKDEIGSVYLNTIGQDFDNNDLEDIEDKTDEEACDQSESLTDDVCSVNQVLEEIIQKIREKGINSIKMIYEENKENRLYVLGIMSALQEARNLKKSYANKKSSDSPMPQLLSVSNDRVLDTVGDITNSEDQSSETEEAGKQTYYPLMIESDTEEPYCISIGDNISLFTRESEINNI